MQKKLSAVVLSVAAIAALQIAQAQVSDVPLSNRDIGASVVAPGQIARIEFIADPAASGGDVFQAVASLDGIAISLVLPDGTEVNAANANSLGYSFTASPDASALGGYIPSPLAIPGPQTWIVIPPGARPGKYQLKLDGRQTAAPATVTASYYSSSNVRAGVLTGSPVYRIGQHMVLSGLIFDGLQAIAGATAVVRIVDTNNLASTPDEVKLADSGPFDAASGDGIYSGVYSATKAGDFTAVFRVSGTSQAGVPFQRTVTVGFKVQAPTAQITSWKDTGLDSDGDGLIDAVLIQVSINATIAGPYQAGVALISDAGVRIFASLTPTLKAGDNTVTFQFTTDALAKLAQDGPYSIRDLVFVYTGSPGSLLADSRPDAGRSAPYAISRRIDGLQATPTQLDFGAVSPGPSKDLTVSIRNTGATPLLVGALPISGTGFSVVTSLPVLIDANGQAGITIRFTPAGAGAANGNLTVAGLTIPLTGSGGTTASAPILSVNPNPFDFQNVTINQSKSQTFTIGNTGTADLHLTGVQAAGDPSFTLAAPFSAATVKPGGAPATVTIIFKPTQASMVTGSLVITSDDSTKQPNLSVPLKGAGINSSTGTISVTVPTTDFGTVNLNSTNDITVTIANTGSGVLSVTPGFSPQNPQFTIISPVGPLSINAGTSQPLKLRFSPTTTGAQKATLTLVNTDVTNPTLTYQFTGTGASSSGGGGPINTTLTVTGTGTSSGANISASGTVNLSGIGTGTFSSNFSLASAAASGSIPITLTIASGNRTGTLTGTLTGSAALLAQIFAGTPSASGPVTITISGGTTGFAGATGTFNLTASGTGTGTTGLGVGSFSLTGPGTINLPSSPDGGSGIAITSITSIAPQQSQALTITGRGFGTHAAYVGDSQYIEIKDVTKNWTAGYTGPGQNDLVGLDVASWSDTQIVIRGFTGPYGTNGWSLAAGDQMRIQVWNAQTGSGPAVYNTTVSGTNPGGGQSGGSATLSVDKGTFESVIGFSGGGVTGYFVNRLTPPSYPATLRSVLVFFPAGELPLGTPVNILAAANTSGAGGQTLTGLTLQRVSATIGAQEVFSEIPVTPMTIASGDFVVGFSAANPAGIYPVVIDTGSPSRQRSYLSSDGTTFRLVDSTSIGAGNFGIRANVDLGGGGGGQGVAALTASVAGLTLDVTSVGSASPVKILTITNTGTASAAATFTLTGPFTVTPSSATLAPNSAVPLSITFKPTTATPVTQTGTLTISAPGVPSIAVALTGTVATSNAGACVAPPSNLVSWYSGDGDGSDLTGSNAGTVQGGTTFAAGQVGQAFNFNGSTGFVQLGNPANLRLTGGVTIEAWINPRSVKAQTAGPPMGAIVTKWAQVSTDTVDSDSYGLWIISNNGAVSLFSALHQAGPREPTIQGGTIPLNAWTHVAMTFDGVSGAYRLYVNGQQVASQTSIGNLFPTNRNVLIGREDSFIGRAFDGLVDEASIFSRALSAAEIQAIVAAGTAGKCKGATPAPGQTGSGCPSSTNIALNGIASQISTDFNGPASLGNNGVINEPNGYGFHTALQPSPWWQVDLGTVSTICEVRMYNRLDGFWDRTKTIRVLLSTDGVSFDTAYVHDGTTWGTGGTPPLGVTAEVRNRLARFVRLQLNETQYLHLREVEVYGIRPTGSGLAAPQPTAQRLRRRALAEKP